MEYFTGFSQSFFVMLPAVVATFGLSGVQVGAIADYSRGGFRRYRPAGRRGNRYASTALGIGSGGMHGIVWSRLADHGHFAGLPGTVAGDGRSGDGSVYVASSGNRGSVTPIRRPPGIRAVLPRSRREHRRRFGPRFDRRTPIGP